MFFDNIKLDLAIRELTILVDVTSRLVFQVEKMNVRLAVLESIVKTDDAQILYELRKIVAIFDSKPSYVIIDFTPGGNMPLPVGSTATATVVVLDQFSQPFPFDFGANPPSWSVSDAAQDTLATGSTPDTENVTSTAAGSQVLSVSVPGVANGSASLTFTNTAPVPVATSVSITTSPDITG